MVQQHSNANRSVYLVVDGGGSTTRVGLAIGHDLIVWQHGPSCNPRTVGEAQANLHLLQLVDHVWSMRPADVQHVDCTCFALSTVSTQTELAAFRASFSTLQSQSFPLRRSLCWVSNDVVPLMFVEDQGVQAVTVVCGTGTGFLARGPNDRWARASGLEYLLADEGGGFDIGIQGLRAVVRAADGRGPETLLARLADAWYASDPEQLYDSIYHSPQPKSVVASFAPVVLQASAQRDPVALAIVRNAAEELAQGIEAVADRAGIVEDAPVVMSGSLLLGEPDILRQHLTEMLAVRRPQLRLVAAPANPLELVLRLAHNLQSGRISLERAASVIPIAPLQPSAPL